MLQDPSFQLVMIGVLSITCQLIATKVRLPAILPLLLIGILVGPVTGILDSDALFGDLLFPFVSLAVAIILFEGALTLNFKELGAHGKVVTSLCTIGVFISWIVVAPAAHYILDLSWQMAFLFSAIVTVTGPTVIMPLLRSVRPSHNISQVLRWEGIIIDPIGAILAVLVFEFILASQNAFLFTLFTFGKTVVAGSVVGVLCGFILGWVLKRHLVPEYLVNTLVFSTVLGAFQLSNIVAHESGLITVTIMGIWLANSKNVDVEGILEFKETLSVLLISGLFIILAARVDLSQVADLATGAGIILAIMFLVARPLAVMIATQGTDIHWKEKVLINWIAPRGIVAAAVSALFALKLQQQGYENAELIVSLVFFIIISTVLLQSISAKPIAAWLGVQAPTAKGFLLFGANEFARALAKELTKSEVKVLVADTNWESISIARMDGINTYYGNPSSEHAQRTMDLTGIGQVLIVSPYRYANSLVTHHFQHELGNNKVTGLSYGENSGMQAHQPNQKYRQSLGLFSGHTYSELASLMREGAEIKSTKLTEEYSFKDYQNTNAGKYIPLIVRTDKNKIIPVRDESELDDLQIKSIVSLILPL
ncbi:cation:proton antiporter [Glaciecola sp. 1036]|uniref:cation:proton antiporter n=1 Tax=Alteromonadaceae TaxID=72275 RepID=UPI003D058E9D